MPNPTLRGDDNPILQKNTWAYNASSGGTYAEEYRGLNLGKMIALWNGQIYRAQSGRLSYANGVTEMQIEWCSSGLGGAIGNNNTIQVTTDRWECPEPRIERPIMQHPTMVTIISALASAESGGDTWANRNKIAKNIADALNAKGEFAKAMLATCAGWAAFTGGAYFEPLMRLSQMMVGGQTDFQDASYAVRHTTNAPAGWGLNQSDLGVNKVYSNAQFLTETTDGALWYYPMPGRLQFKLTAAYNTFIATAPSLTGYSVGWLKGPSSESTAARGRVEIQTGYQLGNWSTDLYATY